jgi:hypothetical protein
MTYRGIISKGVVVLPDEAGLPDGTLVEVKPVTESSDNLGELPAFGIWRDRSDLGDSAEASLKLRESLECRDKHE